MARPLPSIHMQQQHNKLGSLPAALASFLALTAVFSLVIFMCGAHQGMIDSVMGRGKAKAKAKTKAVRLGGENTKKSVKEKMSSKALTMISWRKVDGEEQHEEDGVVWKKTIIKGEKCRPLDFSGQILYDAEGKLLQD